MGLRIIIVDDEQDFLDSIRRGLYTAGYSEVSLISNPKDAAMMFERGETFDIALMDVTMPGMSGVELLGIVKSQSPGTECIMVTAVNEANVAVECIKKGAYDYLVKPVTRDALILKIQHAQERKRLLEVLDLSHKEILPGLRCEKAFENIVSRSPKILRVLKEAELHALSDVPVLITGESGTGKELLAKAVHAASPRSQFPFTPVNMASVSANLFDSDFFGHTRGAFTGAEKDRAGYLESTHRGTLFLDEIGTLPPDLQGKLLRVLQEGEFTKLGTSKIQRIDVRFTAATNEDLEKLLARGLFRKDLYYRLKGAWLHLPPLRERPEDIPLLTAKFLEELRGAANGGDIEEEALSILMDYEYPGNIRELKSILRGAFNLAQGSDISARHLPDHLRARKSPSKQRSLSDRMRCQSLADVEKSHILEVYRQTGRNKAEAAKILGIGLNTLRRKLELYGEK
jgi:two-component system response regulator AtoC